MLLVDGFPNAIPFGIIRFINQWEKRSPTLPKIIAGTLEACMMVTTDMEVIGEIRTANKPK